nr:metallophosphoesterase [uncultured Carboxylicivirga sp.]
MKVQYCSDLHLEFAQNSLFLHKNPIKPVGDILILAGDITYWGKKHFTHWFFDYVSDHFKKVYYIPGNHEFYTGKDLRILDKPVYEGIRENVYLVNNKVITVDDVDFFFTVLWSNIPESKSLRVEHGVGDFHQIKYRGNRLNYKTFNQLHEDSLSFLKEAIPASNAQKKVVVTHHIPTQICNPECYRNSDINSAFVSEQYSLIHDWDVDYWIYGHHHANMPETNINGTRLVTNQLGYIDWGEHHSYRHCAWFDIE